MSGTKNTTTMQAADSGQIYGLLRVDESRKVGFARVSFSRQPQSYYVSVNNPATPSIANDNKFDTIHVIFEFQTASPSRAFGCLGSSSATAD
jgi:hypothetical protein